MASNARYSHGSVAQRLALALHRELAEGEQVVWESMKLARIEPKGFAIYLFAIPWTAFALFWMGMAGLFTLGVDSDPFAWVFPLFGLPFVLIGLGMMMAPFLSFFQRGRVLFAVTDRRVLKLSLGGELTVVSVPASKITESVRNQSADVTGGLVYANIGGVRMDLPSRAVIGEKAKELQKEMKGTVDAVKDRVNEMRNKEPAPVEAPKQ